jgi:hypothetical protein
MTFSETLCCEPSQTRNPNRQPYTTTTPCLEAGGKSTVVGAYEHRR